MAKVVRRHGNSSPSSVKRQARRTPRAQARAASSQSAPEAPLVIGIGASAGGLQALSQLLACMPKECGAALVVAQHLDPNHESMLTELLARKSPLRVVSIGKRVRPLRNHVYVVPPARTVKLQKGLLTTAPLERSAPVSSLIDELFMSLAAALGKRSVGVLLSGSGRDGVVGLKAIQAAGGRTLCQSPEDAQMPGMPRAAIQEHAADLILDIPTLANELASMGHVSAESSQGSPLVSTKLDTQLASVCAALRSRTGLDFATYKPSTVKRRLARRMSLGKFSLLRSYVRHLESDPHEAAQLAEDLLIHVTRFFRDPAAFLVYKRSVLPRLLSERAATDPIRFWIPGCATGEEVYSFAITVMEYLEGKSSKPQIQIFGTDISERAIAQARLGTYPAKIRTEVPAELLAKYFTKVEGGYQIARRIRALCAFARHDVTSDPPFSRLDLISCRNVLIYHTTEAQQRSLAMFHYALLPNGVLILGPSESTGARPDLFSALSARCRIFLKKSARTHNAFRVSPQDSSRTRYAAVHGHDERTSDAVLACREADRILLGRFAPTAVLVSPDLQILQFRGQPGPYLRPASGAASLNVLKMVHPSLSLHLRRALRPVNGIVKASSVKLTVEIDSEMLEVRMEVAPIHIAQGKARHALVVFHAVPALQLEGKSAKGTARPHVERLRSELAAARDHLQSLIAEHEAANNALQAALDAGQSSNEELQSTNEELETAKEELQSTNEELTTVNDELQARNLELNQLNSDLAHVLASIDLPVLTLGRDARIRRFNEAAERALHLMPADVGRTLADVRISLPDVDLAKMVAQVIKGGQPAECEIAYVNEQACLLRVRPYRAGSGGVDGVVVTLSPCQSTFVSKPRSRPVARTEEEGSSRRRRSRTTKKKPVV